MAKASKLNSFLSGVSGQYPVKVETRKGTQFHAHLSGPDPEDRKWNLISEKLMEKDAVTKAYTGKTIDGQTAIAPESWYNYMSRKVDRELLANYEGWAINQVDLSTPEAAEFWGRVLPWIREKREALLEEQANIQKQLALIKIRGVQSEEDMMLVFAVQNNMVQVSDKPLYQLDDPAAKFADKATSSTFVSGLLNPWQNFFITSPLTRTGGNNAKTVPVYDFADPMKTVVGGLGLGATGGAQDANYRQFNPKMQV